MTTKTSRSGDAWLTRVTVLEQEEGDYGPILFEGRLDEVIASLIAVRDGIPGEYRAAVECEIGAVGGYDGDGTPCVKISYTRPATDEEIAAVREAEARQAEWWERRERQQLEALLAKYGPPSSQ